jgi:hypothetical protein
VLAGAGDACHQGERWSGWAEGAFKILSRRFLPRHALTAAPPSLAIM